MRKFINMHWESIVLSLCDHEVAQLTLPTISLTEERVKEIALWTDTLEWPAEDTTMPEYYRPLCEWLEKADSIMTNRVGGSYCLFYDEKLWKHPWLGEKVGEKGFTYHHVLLNVHDFICRKVLGLSSENPRNQDLTYEYMLSLVPPKAVESLFMEIRARTCYGVVANPKKNSLVHSPYFFAEYSTLIPTEYLCNHLNYQG